MGSLERVMRMARHTWHDLVASEHPLPLAALLRLGQHVTEAERTHTGEIRIYIEPSLPWRYLKQNVISHELARQRAIDLFSTQRIWDTAQNNGVLVYLLMAERCIEIIADRGITQRVDAGLWREMVMRLSEQCRDGAFETGLRQTVSALSALLEVHFPWREGDINPNELTDEPVIG